MAEPEPLDDETNWDADWRQFQRAMQEHDRAEQDGAALPAPTPDAWAPTVQREPEPRAAPPPQPEAQPEPEADPVIAGWEESAAESAHAGNDASGLVNSAYVANQH